MFKLCTKIPHQQTLTIGVFQKLCSKAATTQPAKASTTKSQRRYGQPTFLTHPQLMKEGEVTPMIHKSEFQERRQKLIEAIATHTLERNKNLKKHLIIVPSASKKYMSDKIPYVFRQNTDFLYLSGCQEPDSCLVLAANRDSPSQHCVTLFMRNKDSHSELWDGPRTSPEDAVGLFGVDQALPMSELENYLQSYMKSNRDSTLWFDYVYVCRYDYMSPVQTTVHKVMCDYLNEIINKMWESPKPFIHRLRLIKSKAEIALMEKSCEIASEAIVNTIAASKPDVNEHEIYACVDYQCRMKGAEFLAYPPVVAGGERANIIHYINNNQIVNDGEMVLMDAGCEYHGYSSDITRTWPINGKFTPEQLILYEIILKTQTELIDLCKNFPTLDSLFDSMCLLLGKGLQEVGLIPKKTTTQSLVKAAYEFCPHHVSHYLGMDVHDTPLISRNIKIEPGMIITIEPGIYTHSRQTYIPQKYRGLGIRIEDDVLITDNGPIVLSRKCPRLASDIEAIASQNQNLKTT